MAAEILAIVGILMLVVGVVNRRLRWARPVIVIGLVLLVGAFVTGGGLQAIKAGWQGYH